MQSALYADDFARTSPQNLGASWTTDAGRWRTDGRAISNSSSPLAHATAVSCRDCRVEAQVSAGQSTAVALRVRAGYRFELQLRSNGRLRIVRITPGSTYVLAELDAGVGPSGTPTTISLSAEGTTSVRLVAWVNGISRANVVDTSGSFTAAGGAGISASQRDASFQRFRVYGP